MNDKIISTFEDESEILMYQGHRVKFNFSRSVWARLIQASDATKANYKEIREYISSFENVKIRESWNQITVVQSKRTLVKMNLTKNDVYLCLALTPAQIAKLNYEYEDVSDVKAFEATPVKFRINENPESLKKAIKLVNVVMSRFKVAKTDKVTDIELPEYQSHDELINNGKIKVYVRDLDEGKIYSDQESLNIYRYFKSEAERNRMDEELRLAEEARLAEEEAEKQRIAAEEAERQRIAAEEEAEKQRIAAEEEAEKQRIAAEEAERQRIAEEEAERQRIAAEEAERQRIAAEEEAERQRLEAERLAREEAETIAETEEEEEEPAEEETEEPEETEEVAPETTEPEEEEPTEEPAEEEPVEETAEEESEEEDEESLMMQEPEPDPENEVLEADEDEEEYINVSEKAEIEEAKKEIEEKVQEYVSNSVSNDELPDNEYKFINAIVSSNIDLVMKRLDELEELIKNIKVEQVATPTYVAPQQEYIATREPVVTEEVPEEPVMEEPAHEEPVHEEKVEETVEEPKEEPVETATEGQTEEPYAPQEDYYQQPEQYDYNAYNQQYVEPQYVPQEEPEPIRNIPQKKQNIISKMNDYELPKSSFYITFGIIAFVFIVVAILFNVL